jgi:hypothetical protein
MDSSLSLSFELVYLMSWLLKNEKTMLNNLVKHAIKNGFDRDVKQLKSVDFTKISDQFYHTILDFLLYLEEALKKDLNKIKLDKQTEKIIFPIVKNINQKALNTDTIKRSLQQTKAHFANKNGNDKTTGNNKQAQEAREILFKHVLKNWKPTNNEQMN